MAAPIDCYSIPDLLKQPQQTAVLEFRQDWPEFDSLTPVFTQVTLYHGHHYLQVQAMLSTIVTLTCDRCLRQYNYRLHTHVEEYIWLVSAPNLAAAELAEGDDLTETLPVDGVFNLTDWVYQQLCLALPRRQLCNLDCEGLQPSHASYAWDNRWQALQHWLPGQE